jgi:hypothetical protein
VQRRALSTALLLTLLVGACGGESPKSGASVSSPKSQAPARDPLALPAGVPRSPTGPADAGATRTIRGWAQALRVGDVARAASYWGVPARIQNGTPVLRLGTRVDLRTFNESLTCGAVLTGAGAARGFTIATFRLTQRRGGDCGGGVGQSARTALVVRGGRIVGWYRLPDATPAPVV